MLTLLKTLVFSKNLWMGLTIAGALAAAYFWVFQRGVEHQRQKDAPVITRLTSERDVLAQTVADAQQTAKNQKEADERARAQLIADQQKTLSGLKAALDKARSHVNTVKETVYVQTPQYVTEKADASCVVPVGFVRLHNLSAASDPDTGGPTQGPAISGGGPPDADAPSGVALSAVAETVGGNYAECQDRKAVIDSWQTWYNQNLKTWLKAVQDQQEFERVGAGRP